jgi:isopentenyl diphosphate isomerase/L-lactate dehydrogenase-like FMN-dependent dehydrogenase
MRWHVDAAPPTPQCLQRVAAAAADAGVEADPGVKRAIDAMITSAATGRPDGH